MMKDPNVTATIGAANLNGRHGSLFLTLVGQGLMRFVPVFKNAATGVMQFGCQRDLTLKADEPRTVEFPMPDSTQVEIFLRVDFFESPKDLLVTAASVATDAGDENNHIEILRQTANQTDLRLTDLPGPRVLLFVDSFYPGWKATVNGKEVPLLAANNAFKAVIVPAGSSELRFTFSSTRVTAGIALAGIASAIVALAVLAACLDRWRRPAPQP
jgi:hypothetical protein